MMHRNKRIFAICLVLLVVLFFLLDLGRFFSLASLQEHRQALLAWQARHAVGMVVVFLGVYILQTALSLPGAAVLSLAAGLLFGPWWGTLYACSAATIGATLAFLATRYLFHDAVQGRFGSRLAGLNRELVARGLNYLLFLRLVPLFPFFLVNLAAGLTRLPLRTFVVGTLFGIIPGGFVYVNAGASLAQVASPADIVTPRVLGSFALLGVLALVPALYRRWGER